MAPIRFGIIRCDLHAIYYANLMQEHDMMVLRKPDFGKGGYFYFYTDYHDPTHMTIPMVPGFELVKVWSPDRLDAEHMTKLYTSRPQVCDTFEEVSEDVDLVLIANCDEEGTDHLEFATPGLEKGVPTFIDKPFAYDVADARRLVELAQQHSVPVMSLSILREMPHAARFRNRFAELGGPDFALIKGGLYTMNGLIHSISFAQHLFGPGVDSVESMGGDGKPFVVHLDFGGKAGKPGSGVVLNCDVGPTYHCAMYASVYSAEGAIHTGHIGDFEFPWGVVEIVQKIEKMVQTRQSQAPYEEMVENIAVATAARKSLAERRRVYLKEV